MTPSHEGLTPLQYHTSWDWLMPRLKEITELNLKEGREWYYFTITHCHCRIFANTPFGISWEYQASNSTTLNAVWCAVVEFIEWQKSISLKAEGKKENEKAN